MCSWVIRNGSPMAKRWPVTWDLFQANTPAEHDSGSGALTKQRSPPLLRFLWNEAGVNRELVDGG
jgi:hypothetical protein